MIFPAAVNQFWINEDSKTVMDSVCYGMREKLQCIFRVRVHCESSLHQTKWNWSGDQYSNGDTWHVSCCAPDFLCQYLAWMSQRQSETGLIDWKHRLYWGSRIIPLTLDLSFPTHNVPWSSGAKTFWFGRLRQCWAEISPQLTSSGQTGGGQSFWKSYKHIYQVIRLVWQLHANRANVKISPDSQ